MNKPLTQPDKTLTRVCQRVALRRIVIRTVGEQLQRPLVRIASVHIEHLQPLRNQWTLLERLKAVPEALEPVGNVLVQLDVEVPISDSGPPSNMGHNFNPFVVEASSGLPAGCGSVWHHHQHLVFGIVILSQGTKIVSTRNLTDKRYSQYSRYRTRPERNPAGPGGKVEQHYSICS